METNRIFTLEIDYSLTKLQMVEAGHYDYASGHIRENDPLRGEISGSGIVSVNLELIDLSRVLSEVRSGRPLAEIANRGLKMAGIEHLLALGARFPYWQTEFPIVAPGSVWQFPSGITHDAYSLVAYLDSRFGKRRLYLDWGISAWDGKCRFLFVKRV